MTVSLVIGDLELNYLKTINVKTQTTTINKLIKHFSDNGLTVVTARNKFEQTQTFGVSITPANIEFIESIKVVSKSYTIASLIATARELGIKI